jgi:hypothetical protein
MLTHPSLAGFGAELGNIVTGNGIIKHKVKNQLRQKQRRQTTNKACLFSVFRINQLAQCCSA